MAAIRYSGSAPFSTKLGSPVGGSPPSFTKFGLPMGKEVMRRVGLKFVVDNRIMMGKYVIAFDHRFVSYSRIYLGYPKIAAVIPRGTPKIVAMSWVGCDEWFDRHLKYGKPIADVGEKNKKLCGEETPPPVQQLIDSSFVPENFRRDLSILLFWSSLLLDEKCFWTALYSPVKYCFLFTVFFWNLSNIIVTPFTLQYIEPSWKGAVIISLVWFLHRWKENVISHALTLKTMDGANRNDIWIFQKVSSVGLFVIGLMALAGAYGFAVQLILTVGGIGGVSIVFAASDVLENIIGGLSLKMTKPFSLGDRIRAGSAEGTVVKMGLTSTTLLNTEKCPILLPNSLFSCQVIANKSRAQRQAMVTKISVQIDNLDKIRKISKDIEAMLNSNTNVFTEEEFPYCFLSRLEQSYAELTLGCNLKITSKDQQFSTKEDILLQCVQIIKEHGGTVV